MNSVADNFQQATTVRYARTLRSSIGCAGVGLHSGRKTSLRLVPAAAEHGIVFRRTDLGIDIPARFDHVVDTRLCTMLGLADQPQARVGTVEHLMAALTACRITNLLIEIDGPELPVLDGSADPYLFLIDCAGILEQSEITPVIEVLRTVRVEEGEAFAELRPNMADAFDLSLEIDFTAPAIGRQALSLRMDETCFRHRLASARTFTQRAEIAALQAMGLARGGSLDNAIVVDNDKILNPGGLRMEDEFVRHKMLDMVGDLALGGEIRGRVVAHRTGHNLNNRLLHALFADPAAWRLTDPRMSWAPLSQAVSSPLTTAFSRAA